MVWVTITLTILLLLFLLTEPVSVTFSNVNDELLIDLRFVFFAVTVYPTRKRNNEKNKKRNNKSPSSKIYLHALYRMRRRVRITLDELSVGILPLPPHLAAPLGETISALLARYTRDNDPSRIRLFQGNFPLRFCLKAQASLYDLLRYLHITKRMKKKMEKTRYVGQ